jgi:hypothetical protein
MLPLKDGAYVVARFVESLDDIKNGTTYVVVTDNNGIVYKRVYNTLKQNGHLSLQSDNKSYASFEVPASEVLELWEFTCSINTQEYDAQELKISSIAQMLTDLQVELKELSSE